MPCSPLWKLHLKSFISGGEVHDPGCEEYFKTILTTEYAGAYLETGRLFIRTDNSIYRFREEAPR